MDEAHIRKILEMAMKNRYDGADKTTLLRTLKGVSYKDLEATCNELEERGLVNLDWFEMNDFVVIITDKGVSYFHDDATASVPEEKPKKYKCPLCETIVDAKDMSCPGCGAEFE